MGWVWRDDEDDDNNSTAIDINPRSDGDRCLTRKVVKTQCKTEEVEPGKFVRKCEKTEQLLRDCAGRPVEVVQSNKEYTEDDVTEEVLKGSATFGSSQHGAFDFPGLRSDIEDIERNFMGGLSRFFEAAEELKSGFFSAFGNIFDEGPSSPLPPRRREVPIEGHHQQEAFPKASVSDDSGHVDLSGLARDV
ncbi:fra a 1-associated protein-like [Pyrus communis]|uniref:fra a 1-associated protein-like n=1 Tax=Pyrus communis TaxID=23211 RepID=UPI0035C1F0C1